MKSSIKKAVALAALLTQVPLCVAGLQIANIEIGVTKKSTLINGIKDKTKVSNKPNFYSIEESYESSDAAYQNPNISHTQYLFNQDDVVIGVILYVSNDSPEQIIKKISKKYHLSNTVNTADDNLVGRFFIQQTVIEVLRTNTPSQTEVRYLSAIHQP